ncbi:MAG: hypothetical protein LBS50_00320 [Prevotellaceae bacterium]|jgi:hypothetical protein|nr:hypothetical protein [Prevotellaceae bacterium]
MKKFSFVLGLILCATISYAQETLKPQLPKNEITLSVGDNMFDTQIVGNSDRGIGSYSLSYYNRLANWFWYGASFNVYPTINYYYDFDENRGQYVREGDPMYDLRFSLAPSVRFSYLNKPNVTLYSGLSVGWGLVREQSYLQQTHEYRLGIFFQATAFGFSVGKKFFFGGEIGIGYKGLYSLNVGYRF